MVQQTKAEATFSAPLAMASLRKLAKLRTRLVVTGLLFAVAFVVAGPTSATPAGAAAGDQEISVAHSDLCLGPVNGSAAPGAAIVQQTCTGEEHQQWATVDAGNGFVQLRLAHSSQCMTVTGADTGNLALILQSACTSESHKQFVLEPALGGSVLIKARHSNRCMDITGASGNIGAALIQYDCHGGANQQMKFSAPSNPSTVGKWGSVISTPLVPVAGSMLPNGKVLMWSAYDRLTFGGSRGFTQTMLFDPRTGVQSEKQVSNTGHDMFCPGIANLEDGRILVNGGSDSGETSIYNPATDQWEDGEDMNIPRGYQGTTMVGDGSVLTLGGSWSGGAAGGRNGELWTEESGWRELPGVPAGPFTANDPQGTYRGDNHLWLFAWTGNRVFHAGPTKQMHWIDTNGQGSVTNAGDRGSDDYAMNGNAVMYAPGKILTIGGATAYQDRLATTNATVIDISGGSVQSRAVAPMSNRRGFHSSVVLPSGEVVVTGGQETPIPFSDEAAILETEIWDPVSETFTAAAPMAVPRTYHSISLLLADGRVLTGGGGLCGGCATNHPDVQIFTPPYLLNDDGSNATQPRIINAPGDLDLSQSFDVSTNAPVSEFALVRMASATHSVNNDQRRIPLTPTSANGLTYTLKAPNDAGVAPPGAYMLFAMNNAGVPSVAAVVTLSNDEFDGGGGTQSIAGQVVNSDGSPAAGVTIDLFSANADGSRNAFLEATTTDSNGDYRFSTNAECYVLTFIAPTGKTFTNQSQWYQAPECVGANEQVTGVDATVLGNQGSQSISGRVTANNGSPVAGVVIDLFTANADGSRGTYIGDATTDANGNYQLDTGAACYVLTFIAPNGRTFTNGSQWLQNPSCVDANENIAGVDAVLT